MEEPPEQKAKVLSLAPKRVLKPSVISEPQIKDNLKDTSTHVTEGEEPTASVIVTQRQDHFASKFSDYQHRDQLKYPSKIFGLQPKGSYNRKNQKFFTEKRCKSTLFTETSDKVKEILTTSNQTISPNLKTRSVTMDSKLEEVQNSTQTIDH